MLVAIVRPQRNERGSRKPNRVCKQQMWRLRKKQNEKTITNFYDVVHLYWLEHKCAKSKSKT